MNEVNVNLRAGPVAVAVIVIVLGGGGIVSSLVWAAAKGAFGKVGEAAVGWLLEHSTNPRDLEHQRELAIRRQAEDERWGTHRRELEKMKEEARMKGLNMTITHAPPRRTPILIPKGACVLDGDNFRCNPDAGVYADDGWGRPNPGQEIDWRARSP